MAEGPNERSGKWDMDLRHDRRQNIQGELDFSPSPMGEAREAEREETESRPAVHDPERPASTNRLMEEVCERDNLKKAWQRVQANKGSPGVDGMTVDDLTGYLKQHWPTLREQLLNGTYEPQPVSTTLLDSKRRTSGSRISYLYKS